MDLYEIFITHNRTWTVREIMMFSVIFLVIVCFLIYLLRNQKIVLSQAVAVLVLFLFLAVIFGSTVFTRTPKSYYEYELELFWSWRLVLHGNSAMLKENLLNMLMLLPAGLLLPVVAGRKLCWWKGLLIGVLISAVIETSQLIFCRGLFEWDDMIHNGIGCMTGCIITSWFIKKRKK